MLHTKSNGCFLCLDWALDSTAAGATVLPEVWQIPSTASTSSSASASSCCCPSPLPRCWVRAGGQCLGEGATDDPRHKPPRAEEGRCGGGKGRAPMQDMPQASRMPGSTQPGQWRWSSARHPCCGGQAAPHPRDPPQALLGLPCFQASTAGCPTPRPHRTGCPNVAGAGTIGDPIRTLAIQGGIPESSPAQPQ